MSLLIWLPLNGDLINQGLSNVSVTNNGATVDNSGKIGKCYSFNGTDNYISLSKTPSTLFPADGCSYSFSSWVYCVSAPSDQTAIVSSNAYQEMGFGLGFRTYRKFVGMIMNSGSSQEYEFSYVLPLNEWHHITLTFDSSTKKQYFYVDGSFIESSPAINFIWLRGTFNFLLGRNHQGGWGGWFNGKLNDVRIYDHCLSAKEVKDLAKGLVLHYRLAGPGQENLITGNFSCTSTNTTYKSQGTVGCVLTAADLMANQGRTLILSYDVYSLGDYTQNTAGSWQADRFGIHGVVNYTKSGSSTSTQDYPLAGLLFRGKNGRVFTSWKIPTGITSFNTDLSFSVQTNGREGYAYPASNNSSTWYLKNVKLEWGSIVTPWCPSKRDTLYNTLGYNNNIEYDCSGYSRNGTKNGTIAWDIDSPRYTTSYKLNSTTVDTTSNTISGAAYIVGPCQMPATSNITIAWWDKITKYGRGGIFETTSATSNFQHAYDYNTTAFANWDTTFGIYNGTTRINIFNQIKMDSKWHHYAITYNGVNVIVYRDGVEVQKSALTGNLPAFNGIKIGLGGAGGVYRQINKNTSDFRIYATALSAEDIQELYHSAVIVDNAGKNYAYEYFEA